MCDSRIALDSIIALVTGHWQQLAGKSKIIHPAGKIKINEIKISFLSVEYAIDRLVRVNRRLGGRTRLPCVGRKSGGLPVLLQTRKLDTH
jgi:hypothetical protein